MKDSMEAFFGGVMLLAVIAFLICGVVATAALFAGARFFDREMICKRGCAEWRVDAQTGKREFVWLHPFPEEEFAKHD